MRRRRPDNSGRDAGAALLAAAEVADTAEPLSPLSVLRQRLAEYTALAATAKAAQDMAEYRVWSERSAQAARDLLPYEPPDPGNKVTRFPLLIFDSQRRPLELEVRQSDNVAAPTAEAKTADPAAAATGEVLPPSEDAPKPEAPPAEAKPEDPPPDPHREGFAWRRRQYFAQFGGLACQPEPHWIWMRGRR
jgi:hypothetical protein